MNTEELYKASHHKYYVQDGILLYKETHKESGSIYNSGYKYSRLKGRRYRTHRLIFLMANKELPELVDHVDGDRLNNNISNLRGATPSQNTNNSKARHNCTSKYKGVSFNKQTKKWVALASLDKKSVYLGRFHDQIFAANKVDCFYREWGTEYNTFNFPKENERSAL